MKKLVLFATLLLAFNLSVDCSKLLAFTFGNAHSDLVKRQLDSATFKNVSLNVIEQEGNVVEVEILAAMRDYVETMKDEKDRIVIFMEKGSLFLNQSEEIIRRFEAMDAKIVISASHRCYPDIKLKEIYPEAGEGESRFVEATGIMGYADALYEALTLESLKPITNSQYYFSKLFTNTELRTKLNMKLDSRSVIFQNMYGSFDDVVVEYAQSGEGYLSNNATGTIPAIVQPNGNNRHFNTLTNYLGMMWNPVNGCQHCSINKINLTNEDSSTIPRVTVAVFIDRPTPFLIEFFNRVSKLSYAKSRIDLRISNMEPSHESIVKSFIDESGLLYNSITYVDSSDKKTLIDRRSDAMENCYVNKCDYLLFIDSVVQLTNPSTIETLISYNKSVIAPIVSRRGQLWSNFWGAISADGYYSRSFDYLDVVNGVKKGLWNVPHIHSIFLMKAELIPTILDIYSPMEEYKESEIDMLFSGNMRRKELFMFVANEDDYGYLVDAENTTTEHLHNDLWEIFSNPLDWKEKYIHENYSSFADENVPLENITQPCPDVFWWPFVSETFAKHMIEEMESFGQWSDGKNTDSRLEGGYENVPTRDIHMRQVDWEQHWMQVLKTYVYPMQVKLFQGYYDTPLARMNFVVRYMPTEQNSLRPHQDSSSYSLNIALNKAGVDYEGGGTKFNRYDCSVTQNVVGWVLMHPGRITHIHEGLPTTKGTRYIFVTFVNP